MPFGKTQSSVLLSAVSNFTGYTGRLNKLMQGKKIKKYDRVLRKHVEFFVKKSRHTNK